MKNYIFTFIYIIIKSIRNLRRCYRHYRCDCQKTSDLEYHLRYLQCHSEDQLHKNMDKFNKKNTNYLAL